MSRMPELLHGCLRFSPEHKPGQAGDLAGDSRIAQEKEGGSACADGGPRESAGRLQCDAVSALESYAASSADSYAYRTPGSNSRHNGCSNRRSYGLSWLSNAADSEIGNDLEYAPGNDGSSNAKSNG